MYNEGAPEFIIDQGLYYPTSTNYAYYCTGFESPSELDDHHRIFAVDGQDLQYAGAQTEILPYVYYTPSYDYAQSPYNPYNPYIPGAIIGVDDPFAGTQQFYTIPSYQNTVSPSAYYPVDVQSRPEMAPNTCSDPLFDSSAYTAHRPINQGLKPSLSSASAAYTLTTPRPSSNPARLSARVSEVPRANAGSSRPSMTYGTALPGSFPNPAPPQVIQGRHTSGSIQSVGDISNGRSLSHLIQSKVTPVNNGFSDFGSSAHRWTAVDKYRSKVNHGRALMDVNRSPDLSIEHNRGPRTNKLNSHIAAKPLTSKAGECVPQEDIIIYTDQYNKDDFRVDYVNAKFFVIKSYSEDDVHKSIKYNVWSSTPNGNKKLDNAYEEAQRIAAGEPRGCPIFLFFSVNASGQFCGMAEMIGPVDFNKDMDFWQQDKWSGSFPVKWHIIKDVPNTNFRHIILENNENKPVTNSRDTQEIGCKQGLEILKIFKKISSKTSLLDDFLYYENRQKILKEEKSRLLTRRYPLFVPVSEPPRKLNPVVDLCPSEEAKLTKHTYSISSEKAISPSNLIVSDSSTNGNTKPNKVEVKDNISSPIIFGSLPINVKPDDAREVGTEPVDVVTVGSIPIKLNGFVGSRLTFGSVPLNPKT